MNPFVYSKKKQTNFSALDHTQTQLFSVQLTVESEMLLCLSWQASGVLPLDLAIKTLIIISKLTGMFLALLQPSVLLTSSAVVTTSVSPRSNSVTVTLTVQMDQMSLPAVKTLKYSCAHVWSLVNFLFYLSLTVPCSFFFLFRVCVSSLQWHP